MKSNSLFLLALLSVIGFAAQGCLKDQCERKVSYVRVDPIYKTVDEIHTGAVVNEAPRDLTNPGNIYYYNDQIFINERHEGIHVIDNTNPSNPVNIGFISIPGNENLAIKNGILYANSYVDLLTIDLQGYELIHRTENVFPPIWEDVQNNQVLVYFKETPVTEVLDCETYDRFSYEGDELYDLSNAGGFEANFSGSKESGAGIAGSMARFSLVGDYLYVVDETNLNVFELSNPTAPAKASTVSIGWGIETIFPYQDKLFIGSSTGMFIFDNSNPLQPTQLSNFAHASACDPVVVDGNFAYVTLRSGNACNGFTNQLDLVDISNITSPVLVKSFPMDNPHGLAIKGGNLYLCEGDFGLKSFDISIPSHLGDRQLDHETGLHAFDAIALPGSENLLLVVGQDGFYQYNTTDPSDLRLLSVIQVAQ